MELVEIEISISSKWPLKFLRRPLYGPPLDAALRFIPPRIISCALFYPATRKFLVEYISFILLCIPNVSSIDEFLQKWIVNRRKEILRWEKTLESFSRKLESSFHLIDFGNVFRKLNDFLSHDRLENFPALFRPSQGWNIAIKVCERR